MTTSTDDQTPKSETNSDDQTLKTEPLGPIPPSDKPKQYRAIGLLQGKYVPGEEIERGTLIASDGTNIDAVVLGKLLGLLKSRIDLEKEHLWVVYPRTRDKEQKGDESGSPQESTSETEEPEAPPDLPKEPTGDDESTGDDEPGLEESEEAPSLAEFAVRKYLHVQLAGIWEPESLHPDSPTPAIEQQPNYFSIQGEVVYQNKEDGWVMVKIIQFSRKKPDEKPPYFNLKLLGFLPDKPVKNFWHLHVEREGTDLVIQDGKRIAYLGKKKPPKKGPPKKKPRRGSATKQQPPTAAASPKEPPKLKKKSPTSD